ncbi:MAG: hypothetical protein DCC65_04870 [Planctomycetota bacterium]|nr:MAG: hypothetical protein DCC65_04870 [Planctomycetota bacterium]
MCMTDVRARFAADELAIVLSHYDLGFIHDIREFPRGSHLAAKLIISTDKSKYILKRRPKGKDDPRKVAFAHALQLYLAEKNFPLPHLVGTRRDNNSMLKIGDAIYEVFEFIDGGPYDMGLLPTYQAGKTLGLYHQLVKDYDSEYEPPPGTYHAAKSVHDSIPRMGEVLRTRPSAEGRERELNATVAQLREIYAMAAGAANEAGLPKWAPQIIHSDWHPGNMIFDKGHVVAVIDYDAAREAPRVVDIANGCLQFSLVTGDRDVATWEDRTDMERARRFLRGYDEMAVLTHAELKVIPLLMQEALIAQAISPILKRGTFAGLDGFDFLKMLLRKLAWLQANAGVFELDSQEG